VYWQVEMTANEIRRSFLAYFEADGHRVVPSAPLVPHDDPTLLFNNAGMNQFKDVFRGRDRRDYTRAATAQKCMRVSGKHNDLDNVGPSPAHHTFFEMLGNFSFGDYFKAEAIPLAWTLLTREWDLPADRLHVSVFAGETGVPRDEEAARLWRALVPDARLVELGAADNFWQMGDTGPCGPCSEIHYFRGADLPCPEEASGGTCQGVACGCARFVEVWNNVFMQYDRQPDGTLVPLPAPSIDTGMGLERVTALLQGHLSNYDTDLFTPLLAAIGDRAGRRHGGTMDTEDVSMRVVADHARAMTFLIADGVVPSNEWRGYVLRKIMRRAMRHGKRLGLQEPFLHGLVPTLVREFGDAYPELVTSEDLVTRVIRGEEERFDAVLTAGLPRLEDVLDEAAGDGGVVSGDAAFRLYDTYGLPRDFIEDMVEERHLRLDTAAFERALEGQRSRARAGSKFKGGEGAGPARPEVAGVARTAFCGYEHVRAASKAVALVRRAADGAPQVVDRLGAGDTGWVVLEETPFYLESGGQVSDTGMLHNAFGFAATVADVEPVGDGVRGHLVQVDAGEVTVGAPVTAEVDAARRAATRRNHTATHLLHAALRSVLGDHVKQAGSLVAPDRLRFDFVHFAAVTHDQLAEIERLVNEQVLRNAAVTTEVQSTDQAIAAGAMALFGEKYGDRVRVVAVPGYSLELCGGTHVAATGEIGLFAITGESGVAAGTRRIEAITGLGSLRAYAEAREELGRLGAVLNGRPGELAPKIVALQDEHKRVLRELQEARVRAAMGGGAGSGATAPPQATAGGVALLAERVEGLDRDALRGLVDRHRSRMGTGVVVLAAAGEGKVSIVVGVTPDLTAKAPAGAIVKALAPLVGGRGGGRPDFAEAGGKDVERIAEMLAATPGVIESILGSA
jgi:alanyl-tRNA synthetase